MRGSQVWSKLNQLVISLTMQFGSQSEAVKQLSDAILDMDTDGDGCISSCVNRALPSRSRCGRSLLDRLRFRSCQLRPSVCPLRVAGRMLY